MDLKWIEDLLKDFNRARSLTVAILIRYAEWEQLANLRCFPSDYHSIKGDTVGYRHQFKGMFSGMNSYRLDSQATELLRKCTDLPCNLDTVSAARRSFVEAEVQCLGANRALLPLRMVIVDKSPYLHYSNPAVGSNRPRTREEFLREEKFLRLVRSHCTRILGKIPDDFHPKFSSGSTFSDVRNILPMDKMSSHATVSPDCWSLVNYHWSKTLWSRGLITETPDRSLPELVSGNKFCTVPKTAVTDRGICTEPSLNVAYQLSVGSVIRRRLRAEGVDLKLGQLRHQSLVKAGSLTREIGTIDLSNASDTISTELVKCVLPACWFDLLDALRSKETRLSSTWHKNQKFSSMGNGFTFELESLIFYSICCAVLDQRGWQYDDVVSVYGDDIIVPTRVAVDVCVALSSLGFTPNPRKTFVDGTPFRESCGGDFFLGYPTRGYHVEKLEIQEPTQWIEIANGLSRMAGPDLHDRNDRGVYLHAWLRVLSRIPKHLRSIRGPAGLGDSVIYDPDWRRFSKRVGDAYLVRGITAQYDKDAYTRYDRKFWTRDSIIAAAVLGYLHNASDVQDWKGAGWQLNAGRVKLPRKEPSGWISTKFRVYDHSFGPSCEEWFDTWASRRSHSSPKTQLAEFRCGLNRNAVP